jgi:DNA-binding LacI/PurR family transcriptional regulator
MHELLTLPVPPTAVVFASDKMALGGYLAAADLGVRIPHDISVVGYDDTFEAAVARPALTSVRQPFEAMARAGFDILTTVPSQPSLIECDARLVVRASTGHCRRQGATFGAVNVSATAGSLDPTAGRPASRAEGFGG